MILSGNKIHEEHEAGRINISPFSASQLTTNSYDLRLGSLFIRYTDEVIDPARVPAHELFEAPSDGLRLAAGDFVLGHSMEVLGSDHYVPIIHARSSIARLGLFVHVTADLIDIGSHGNVTFQLLATLPIHLRPGMKIGQVSFWKPYGDIKLYEGKYQGSRGPRASECYRDLQGSHLVARTPSTSGAL
jgi:dCTP deaminase